MIEIKSFTIKKLHGYKDLELKFKDNTLVLVGENGSGKTTVLRLFYYFLTSNWDELANYSFDKLTLSINNEVFEIDHSYLSQLSEILDRKSYFKKLSFQNKENVKRILQYGDDSYAFRNVPRYLSITEYREFRKDFENLIIEVKQTNTIKLKEISDNINKLIKNDFQILYLPTYRRIERDFVDIMKDYDLDLDTRETLERRQRQARFMPNRGYVELVEFGMNDVEHNNSKFLKELKEFQRNELNTLASQYLDDIVNKKYNDINIKKIKSISSDDVENVIKRIDETMLKKTTKELLMNKIKEIQKLKKKDITDDYIKVICHYFIKLLDIEENLIKKEKNMKDFCRICNNYINNKTFEYESSSFSFSIKMKKNINDTVEFNQLSSGEKQIVSLFSQLYLAEERTNYFIIIDEPELSLSVPWQKTFLSDIRNGLYCKGLFAVTHSPFVFDNELEKYTCGIGEFAI